MIGTFTLLPLYFAGANAALLSGALSPEATAAELRSWNAWNWGRTGLALVAVVLCCAGTACDRVTASGSAEAAPPGHAP